MPERPLECSQCKKCADVIYTEMVNDSATTTEMCRDCPVLNQKLEGQTTLTGIPRKEAGLFCSHCKTSLESILLGGPLGCKECYFIFQDVLVDQLVKTQLISPKLQPRREASTPTLHIGKTPFMNEKPQNTTRTRELNEALSEALKGENYEEAAWIRDQINSLTKATDDPT